MEILPKNVITNGDLIKQVREERTRLSREEFCRHYRFMNETSLAQMEKGFREDKGKIRGIPSRNVCRLAEILEFEPLLLIDSQRSEEILGVTVPEYDGEEFRVAIKALREASAVSVLTERRRELFKLIGSMKKFLPHAVHPRFALVYVRAIEIVLGTENRSSERRALRRQALKVFENAYEKYEDPIVILRWTNFAVDCFHEGYFLQQVEERQKLFSALRKNLLAAETELRKEKPDVDVQLIIALKAQACSLAACALMTSPANTRRRDFLLRLAETAISMDSSSPVANTAKGMALASVAKNHQELLDAESYFLAGSAGNPLGMITLSKYYRRTHCGEDALKAFINYSEVERDEHRLYRNAFVAGEAYRMYDNENRSVDPRYTKFVLGLLLKAFDAGYHDFRTLAALAIMRALRGDVQEGLRTLSYMSIEAGKSWDVVLQNALKFIADGNMIGLREAFVVGVDTAFAWNTLGTYYRDFCNDNLMAIKLYRAGIDLFRDNSLLRLNLAISLNDEDDTGEEYREALERAEAFSTPELEPYIIELKSRSVETKITD